MGLGFRAESRSAFLGWFPGSSEIPILILEKENLERFSECSGSSVQISSVKVRIANPLKPCCSKVLTTGPYFGPIPVLAPNDGPSLGFVYGNVVCRDAYYHKAPSSPRQAVVLGFNGQRGIPYCRSQGAGVCSDNLRSSQKDPKP